MCHCWNTTIPLTYRQCGSKIESIHHKTRARTSDDSNRNGNGNGSWCTHKSWSSRQMWFWWQQRQSSQQENIQYPQHPLQLQSHHIQEDKKHIRVTISTSDITTCRYAHIRKSCNSPILITIAFLLCISSGSPPSVAGNIETSKFLEMWRSAIFSNCQEEHVSIKEEH